MVLGATPVAIATAQSRHNRGKRLRCRNQTPAAFIEKRRHRRKPLSNGFDIDHHHNIWYGKSVVNPYLTLSKVDSIISGRALRC